MRLTRILGGLAAVTLACPAYGQDLPRIEPLERSQKTYPNLSPDGRYILFSAGDGFNLNLFVRDIDSSEIVQFLMLILRRPIGRQTGSGSFSSANIPRMTATGIYGLFGRMAANLEILPTPQS